MTENQPQDADAQKVRKIVRNIVTAYYGASTESDELAELIVIGLNANGFVTTHWREVVPEPAGGWPSQHRYDGGVGHADWCREPDDHEGMCIDRLVERATHIDGGDQ